MEGLINMMEETVLNKIDQIWEGTDYCKCQKCRMDIATYALNRLPARYVSSLAGAMLHKFDAHTVQMEAEVTACVFQAVRLVGENPSHDAESVETAESSDVKIGDKGNGTGTAAS